MRKEERTQGIVIEFAAVVSLQSKPRETKLSLNISSKGLQKGKNVRLMSDWKRPDIMGEIIQENKIILVT
jgi:hypothetical protein